MVFHQALYLEYTYTMYIYMSYKQYVNKVVYLTFLPFSISYIFVNEQKQLKQP